MESLKYNNDFTTIKCSCCKLTISKTNSIECKQTEQKCIICEDCLCTECTTIGSCVKHCKNHFDENLGEALKDKNFNNSIHASTEVFILKNIYRKNKKDI